MNSDSTKFVSLAFIVALLIAGWYVFSNKPVQATINGTINFTALKPDPDDKGNVLLKYRTYNSNDEYKNTNVVIPLKDEAVWIWNGAQASHSYELLAELVIDGKTITTSEPLVVSAPATNQQLNLRVTWRDLPKDVVDTQKGDIKGTVKINGYIPQGSSLNIMAKNEGETDFAVVQTLSEIGPVVDWEWTEAVPLKRYQLKTQLIAEGALAGTSGTVLGEASDNEISMTVNSRAKEVIVTPQPTAIPQPNQPKPTAAPETSANKSKLSGKVYINGPKDANTSLLVMWRTPGKGDYQVIKRIDAPSHDGQYWEWTDASKNQEYELIAVLQVNDNNTATTRSTVVAAPASDVNFTVNTGVIVPKPTGKLYKKGECVSIGANRYNITFGFPRVDKAGKYWVQLGTSSGSSDTLDNKFEPQNSNSGDQMIVNGVDQSRNYYARYAYALCKNCSSNANFSDFSDVVQLNCD